jgi:beta-1,4-glucosyltransferase
MSGRRDIAGFFICNTTTDVFIRFLNRRLRQKRKTVLLFANANLITRCGHLRKIMEQERDLYILNDGIALDAVSWLRFGSTFRENLNGTDFTPALLGQLKQRTRVFLLGGTSEVVASAASVFGKFENVQIVGTSDGYTLWDDHEEQIRQIREARPDVLLVAFGNPLQEEWILQNRHSFDASLIVGVGALFNFVSGSNPRAPELVRKLRLEWAHRLLLEPRRLMGRYTIGMVRFFALALLHDRQRSLS